MRTGRTVQARGRERTRGTYGQGAVDVGGQKRRQAAAEAVTEVSGGGGGHVECAIRQRRRGRAGFKRSGRKRRDVSKNT